MKNHKFQQIRVRVTQPGEAIRFNAQTDKQYARIRGIYVSVPEERFVPGCLLGLKVNNQEVFEDVHEVKLELKEGAFNHNNIHYFHLPLPPKDYPLNMHITNDSTYHLLVLKGLHSRYQ